MDSQALSKENIDSLYVGHQVLALLYKKRINAKCLNIYNAKSSNSYATGFLFFLNLSETISEIWLDRFEV